MKSERNIKTKWDLTLFYKSPKDPQIEKDIKKHTNSCKTFARKYKTQNFTKSAITLHTALSDYEKLLDGFNDGRPLLYFYYLNALDSQNIKYQAEISRMNNLLTNAGNLIQFFPLRLGKIPSLLQKQYLQDKKLTTYKYFLERRFIESKYDLTETAEKIISLKSQPAHMLWTLGLEKVLGKKTVKHEGKDIPISKASFLISDLPTTKRRALHKKILKVYKDLSDFSESEINAIVINKKIDDDLRNIKEPYLARIIGEENDKKVVLNLIDLVTENNKVAHRFYKVKAKLLKLEKLQYADLAGKVGQIGGKYSFNESYNIVLNTLNKYDPWLGNILENLAKNGQIDVYPKKGKLGGALCSTSHNNPILLLLNHVDTFYSVSVLAHETGHAIHSALAKKQPILYEGYPISTAETASTFFEGLVLDELIKTLSKKQKIVALHDKIQSQVGSIFRQVACFNFELELHTQIRKKGVLSKKEIAKLMNKHMKAYLGPLFELTDLDGYIFVGWSHIRSFFYVYTYAYGQLVSNALKTMVKNDPTNIKKIIEFMEAGGSDTPKNIFKSIGINLNDSAFWQEGVKQIENDVIELEKLVKN